MPVNRSFSITMMTLRIEQVRLGSASFRIVTWSVHKTILPTFICTITTSSPLAPNDLNTVDSDRDSFSTPPQSSGSSWLSPSEPKVLSSAGLLNTRCYGDENFLYRLYSCPNRSWTRLHTKMIGFPSTCLWSLGH
ncbi:unnamed protein product [Protopolystoma xenopodis]|uniref:Uncharacterized protein n=1 Tax=Protopolystoma xenopodis TaxID=117903 RepID=A0A3S5A5J7_9PLAT|nr:unnamed protein product [Protopolystoma xenopodis]